MQFEVDERSASATYDWDWEVTVMSLDLPDPLIVDGLRLMRASMRIRHAADRRRVIELATALARDAASPPIAPR
jgi:hypothetical protein